MTKKELVCVLLSRLGNFYANAMRVSVLKLVEEFETN